MSDIADDLTRFEKIYADYKDAVTRLFGGSVGGASFGVDACMYKLVEVFKGLQASRPWSIGDRVALNRTPEISETVHWGWMGAKHFLVSGALGTVSWVEFGASGWAAYIQFDDDSYLDRGTRVPVPCANKRNFGFGAAWLRKVDP